MINQSYLHEVWLSPTGDGQILPTCIAFGPAGDSARKLNETGCYCFLVFWAHSHFEAMSYYYGLFEWGPYTTEHKWDFQPYPTEWVQEQQSYLNALTHLD